ncbi:unnamed protein product [Phytophthora fragariaefolia]|uniref:Unnamed protein product n=1 Tax=Phytophthora fragariaefolia TaxID=1490495 RepID=A0A9W7CTM2_9STRA|nr:unnamed protein product [Phytophthora fragariaefolia]
MTSADFPVSRAMLPTLEEGRETRHTTKFMMQRLLQHTVREFEQLTYTRNGEVDATRWKALSKAQAAHNGQHDDQVKVYRERHCGAVSTEVVNALQADTDAADDLAFAALTPSAVLVSGRALGRVENIMYALGGAHTQEGLALFADVMYDGIADCGVLDTLESDHNEDETSCRFLGYKFVVKRSIASGAKLMRHRDVVYLEYTGYTQASNGERLGFHIEHSVDVPGFPDLHDRNSSRVRQSVRYIFRQKSERVMEIYMLGNMELAGVLNVGGVGVGGANGAGCGDIFSISRLQQCAETRRLSLLIRQRRESIDLLQTSSSCRSMECYLCRRPKRFFAGALLSECDVCGRFVCSKCRNNKKVFVHGGLLGKSQQVKACKTCVVSARAGYAPPPMHLSVSQQVNRCQRPNTTGTMETQIMYGQRYSTSSSRSRASSVGDYSEACSASRTGREFRSCRQGSVYNFSDVDGKHPTNHQLQQSASYRKKSRSSSIDLVSSHHLGQVKKQSGTKSKSGPQQQLPHLPIPNSRIRSGASGSSPDSKSGVGNYLTPPHSGELCDREEQWSRRNVQRQWHENQQFELRRRQQPIHQSGNQPFAHNNFQISNHGNTLAAYHSNSHPQLAITTFEHPGLGPATPYSNSYSSPSSDFPIAATMASSQPPRSERGNQRALSIPITTGHPRRLDLMTQMMELNLKAERTYNATRRNGAFLKSQMRTRQLMN